MSSHDSEATYNQQTHNWVQLSGHDGTFIPDKAGTILKMYNEQENKCLRSLFSDGLCKYVPEFKGEAIVDGKKFIRMQDLLHKFDHPSIMDVKIGKRTYLEQEFLDMQSNSPKLRTDMYQKMIKIDPNEPSNYEHELAAISKQRYMQWRENLSSSSDLGFRIEGIKEQHSNPNRDFKRLKQKSDIKAHLLKFTENRLHIQILYLLRLREIKAALNKSNFFKSHEMIGTSLLFVHDNFNNAKIWLIDFGKTYPLPPNTIIDHQTAWHPGNHEDGYLTGLENLTRLYSEIITDTVTSGCAPSNISFSEYSSNLAKLSQGILCDTGHNDKTSKNHKI